MKVKKDVGSCVHTREKELVRLKRLPFTRVGFRESTRVDTGDQPLYILLIITRISARQRYESQGKEREKRYLGNGTTFVAQSY